MTTRDFSYELPPELIAQHPADRRDSARLLTLDRSTGQVGHRCVSELAGFIPEDGVLVLNDSRVRKARIHAETANGHQRELLFLDVRTNPASGGTQIWTAMTKRPRRIPVGEQLALPGDVVATVVDHTRSTIEIRVDGGLSESWFEMHGHTPLPPYIRREDTDSDTERYQTVYASEPGSVAAPTAGLHLTCELIEEIRGRGTIVARVTLHVGPGTFLPVRTENIDQHVMHSERYEVTADAADTVNAALAEGRPVVAVGTTSVRTLESAWSDSAQKVESGTGDTNLFIRPGFTFNVISGMMTNFHTPESTLLMLVSAFATREMVLRAYEEAVKQRYRFFSYGDAMLIQ